MTILNFGSTEFDIYAVAEQMKARRWIPGLTSEPKGMHTMLSMQHEPARDAYLNDLRACVAAVRASEATSNLTATY